MGKKMADNNKSQVSHHSQHDDSDQESKGGVMKLVISLVLLVCVIGALAYVGYIFIYKEPSTGADLTAGSGQGVGGADGDKTSTSNKGASLYGSNESFLSAKKDESKSKGGDSKDKNKTEEKKDDKKGDDKKEKLLPSNL